MAQVAAYPAGSMKRRLADADRTPYEATPWAGYGAVATSLLAADMILQPTPIYGFPWLVKAIIRTLPTIAIAVAVPFTVLGVLFPARADASTPDGLRRQDAWFLTMVALVTVVLLAAEFVQQGRPDFVFDPADIAATPFGAAVAIVLYRIGAADAR